MNKYLICTLLAVLVGVLAIRNVEREALMKLLNKPQPLARTLSPPQEPLTFSFENCGTTSDPEVLSSLSVTPDPIVLGQNITVAFKGTIGEAIANLTNYKANVWVWKKILGIWTEIPCISQAGSCTYDNFCSLLRPNHDVPPCGPALNEYHVPCVCPFPAGTYSIPPSPTHIKDPGLSWLTNGDYSAKGELLDPTGKRLGCYLLYASLQG